MSWRFPRFRLRDGNALSTDDTNDSFLESADELSGRLNEHNWASGAIPARTDIQDTAAFVWHQVSTTVDLNNAADPNFDPVLASSKWETLEGMTLTITGPAALYWIHASSNWEIQALAFGTASYMRWGIKLDGQVVPESVVGGLEDDATHIALNGTRRTRFPFVTSALLAVPAGQHTIEMCLRADNNAATAIATNVGSRELICLEMRR